MAQVTIYDVAEAAGVSISTVSNALNRPNRVSPATRNRVLAVADELGYVPKPQAVSVARKGMQRIGVVAAFTAYVSFMQRLGGVLEEAAARGVEVSVFDHESAATAASPVLAGLPIRGQLDGLIVMGTRIEPAIEQRLLQRDVPTVVVDAESKRFPVVTCDDVAGGRMAAAHLLDLGHRRFGYILEHQATAYESQAMRRLAGFRAQLDRHGNCEIMIVEAASSAESARSAARALLGDDGSPTAVMAHYDVLAVGVLRAAKDLGLAVPDDISVMGCDDGPMAFGADLTTLRQPFRESGAAAARLLLSMIERPGTARTVTSLDLAVVERSTTGRVHLAEGNGGMAGALQSAFPEAH